MTVKNFETIDAKRLTAFSIIIMSINYTFPVRGIFLAVISSTVLLFHNHRHPHNVFAIRLLVQNIAI